MTTADQLLGAVSQQPRVSREDTPPPPAIAPAPPACPLAASTRSPRAKAPPPRTGDFRVQRWTHPCFVCFAIDRFHVHQPIHPPPGGRRVPFRFPCSTHICPPQPIHPPRSKMGIRFLPPPRLHARRPPDSPSSVGIGQRAIVGWGHPFGSRPKRCDD
jgi:hypothetical protein